MASLLARWKNLMPQTCLEGIAGISDTLYAEPPQPLQPAGQRPALEDAWLFFPKGTGADEMR